MRTHPLLPRLTKDNTVGSPRAGNWTKKEAVVLELISQSLDVKESDITSADVSTDVDSIPSMWARPLLFEMALYDSNHTIHERISGEWRGLLAMLALKEWSDFSLTTEPIEIPDVDTVDDVPVPEFLRALHQLLPKHTLDTETTWKNLDLILFNDNPIGLTSPTTLVCTSVNYFGRIPGVPWLSDEGYLCDPISTLSDSEKAAVASWLKHLQTEKIQKLPLPDDTSKDMFAEWISYIITDLNGLIHKFRKDLGNVSEDLELSDATKSFGWTQDFFRCMDRPVKAGKLDSSVQLVSSRDEPPKTVILVVDESIASTWNEEPHNVVVWGGKTLATAQSFSGKSKLQLPTHVYLRKPEDFFTEKLFVIARKNVFHEEGTLSPDGSNKLEFNGVPATPILPITTELVEYLDVHDLNNRITFEQGTTSIKVNLSLPLSGTNGQSRDFIISKEYSSENVTSIRTVPVLEIWPNFKTVDWQVYYTFFTRASQDTFYAEPFLQSGKTFDTRVSFDDKQDYIKKEDMRNTDKKKDINYGITKTSYLPEAIVCKYKTSKSSGEYKDVGILLISVPDPEPVGASTWTIGVDFGTSSTTVYNKNQTDQSEPPQPVAFDTHLLQVTNSTQRNLLYNNFLSPKRELTPFFSLFQKLGNKEPDKPLLDGHIYFLDNYETFYSLKNIVSDLKWSQEEEDRIRAQAFLEQICLQCAAEAVAGGAKEINWRFSYPLAFSSNDREQFHTIWSKVTGACTSATGLQQGDVISESESVVTARFFARNGGFARGAVCIDIGGETSDVSIWQNDTLQWQTSLRFAGKRIFLDLLKKNPRFLENFGVDNKDIQLLERVSKSDNFYSRADTWIDMWINSSEQDLQDIFAIHGGKPKVATFVQLIAIGIAGLLYYVGLILNYLSENKSFERKMPSVYIGGNGARILHWLANGNFGSHSENNNHLKQVILAASGFDRSDLFNLEITEHHKHEAAFGLVDEGTILISDNAVWDLLAGEVFTENEEDCDWTAILTAERFGNHLKPGSQFTQIENFLESFNAGLGKAIGIPVNFDRDLKDTLDKHLHEDLTQLKLTDPDKRIIEPLFILALKKLLKQKTEEWR